MRPCLTHPFSISRSEKRALSSLCQAKETGDVGPSLEDVLFMITEDVLDFDSAEGCSTGRRHRALREARRDHAHSSLVTLRITHSHPSARGLRLIAPRTHHLRFNHFARPTSPPYRDMLLCRAAGRSIPKRRLHLPPARIGRIKKGHK